MISFGGANGTPGQIAAAQAALTALYPPAISITMQAGAVARLPTSFIVNDCVGTQATSVAVCSFITPSPNSSVFWLASRCGDLRLPGGEGCEGALNGAVVGGSGIWV